MRRQPVHTPMSDYERIITEIAHRSATQFGRYVAKRENLDPHDLGHTWTNDPKPGDIVKCQTQRHTSRWMFAWLVEVHGYSEWLLREIGGERTCRMSNENLTALPGYLPLEGHQFLALEVCRYAAWKFTDQEYTPRWGGIEFPDRHSRDGVVTIRTAFGGALGPDVRVTIPIRATSDLRVREVLAAMRDAWAKREKPEQVGRKP